MDQTLHDLAAEVRNAVKGLEALLEKQKRASKRRLWFVLLIYVPASMLIAMIMTVGTISSCFLGGKDEFPRLCEMMPGYHASQEQNKGLLKQFTDLVTITTRNDKRLDELEAQHKE